MAAPSSRCYSVALDTAKMDDGCGSLRLLRQTFAESCAFHRQSAHRGWIASDWPVKAVDD